MNSITLPNNTKLYTDHREQVGTLNRPFTLSGIKKNEQLAPLWHVRKGKNTECYHWIYSYRYLDDRSKGFDVHVDDNDKYKFKIDV